MPVNRVKLSRVTGSQQLAFRHRYGEVTSAWHSPHRKGVRVKIKKLAAPVGVAAVAISMLPHGGSRIGGQQLKPFGQRETLMTTAPALR